jgi:hypothetical protein
MGFVKNQRLQIASFGYCCGSIERESLDTFGPVKTEKLDMSNLVPLGSLIDVVLWDFD